jgi:hypothetical protein
MGTTTPGLICNRRQCMSNLPAGERSHTRPRRTRAHGHTSLPGRVCDRFLLIGVPKTPPPRRAW